MKRGRTYRFLCEKPLFFPSLLAGFVGLLMFGLRAGGYPLAAATEEDTSKPQPGAVSGRVEGVMLRLGKDVAVPCKICHKPIAVSRIRIHPKAVTCSRPQCNPKRKAPHIVNCEAQRLKV